MQTTADVGKIWKNVEHNLMFIYGELLKFAVIFVSNLITSAVKNVS